MEPAHSSSGPAAAAEARRRVSVLLPLPLPEPYDYAAPVGQDVAPGDYVEVPLGPRRVVGVVWGEGEGSVAEARLRPVARRFDSPPMPEIQRRFVDWVAAYTMAPRGAVLKMALGALGGLEPPKAQLAYRLAETGVPPDLRPTPARRRVLALLADGPPRPAAELAAEAGCGVSVVRGLAEAGALEPMMLTPRAGRPRPDWRLPGPVLSEDQRAAAEDMAAKAREGGYSATLLDGVTGSGKTEVYFEAVAAALETGRQVLVLLPEIALSAQWLHRFERRFGAPPHVWHSELTGAERRRTWREIAEGEARIVVGARSALFLPFAELGLIVVDEEHEGAFKQEEGVIYHARDMAVVRAHLGRIPILLVSATPSLETVVNCDTGRYARLHLPARHGEARLPEIALIDMRREKPERNRFIAPAVKDALARTFEQGEQAMLFLNRRGYAPLTLCRACGFRLQCPNCTAWLVEHRLAGRLQCHHCDFSAAIPQACPSCGVEGSLAACGPGVERVAEEVAQLFPEARVGMMTSDTLIGPHAVEEMVRQVAEHRVDLLIGTQVMAKGHHFPMLTLVGVVDADLGLQGGDLRAAERTFQLLSQVAGRAGRGERPGTVLLQTFSPENPVMQALQRYDRDAFLEREAHDRLEAGMPPFGRLAALIVSGEEMEQVDAVARRLGRTAPRSAEVQVLGPAPAPFALLRGRHRRRLLLKAPRSVQVQPLIAAWLAEVPIPGSVRVQVDIDPYSFL
ncbi:primosomal protein N' [Arenibaculum pallidiluteum]|uniref:primosomal protein N' n=1 Tax=Arenibaculum pallidiluteum TaxID=2812559 RepID=UPI001A960892|nr:primosomal protein N' [Arenibaculum pallidiluteum]